MILDGLRLRHRAVVRLTPTITPSNYALTKPHSQDHFAPLEVADHCNGGCLRVHTAGPRAGLCVATCPELYGAIGETKEIFDPDDPPLSSASRPAAKGQSSRVQNNYYIILLYSNWVAGKGSFQDSQKRFCTGFSLMSIHYNSLYSLYTNTVSLQRTRQILSTETALSWQLMSTTRMGSTEQLANIG